MEERGQALPQVGDECGLPGATLRTDEASGVARKNGLVLRERGPVSGASPAGHVRRELLDAPEVEKDDLAPTIEQVIPGVRVGVENTTDQNCLVGKSPQD